MNTKKVVTREEMQKIDRIAIEEYSIPGLILMENAGRCVADEAMSLLKTKNYRNVCVVCGNGNNGGDGFVSARHLFNAGYDVKIICLFDENSIIDKPDAKINFEIAKKMKIKMHYLEPAHLAQINDVIKDSDVIIDAMFGTGLTRKLSEEYCALIDLLNNSGKSIIAVDIPSGLDANEGIALGAAIKADVTVTMCLAKKGFFINKGPEYVGELKIADISAPIFLLLE